MTRPTILLVDSDQVFAQSLGLLFKLSLNPTPVFRHASDVYAALDQINTQTPDLIILDPLLTGPDGFTLLNELATYPDTSAVPVVLLSTIDFRAAALRPYGVVAALNKALVQPADLLTLAESYLHACPAH